MSVKAGECHRHGLVEAHRTGHVDARFPAYVRPTASHCQCGLRLTGVRTISEREFALEGNPRPLLPVTSVVP